MYKTSSKPTVAKRTVPTKVATTLTFLGRTRSATKNFDSPPMHTAPSTPTPEDATDNPTVILIPGKEEEDLSDFQDPTSATEDVDKADKTSDSPAPTMDLNTTTETGL